MSTMSAILIDCLRQFSNLISSKSLQQHIWHDELGRLRVWAANIGAHQVGQSSLDYRLRDASNVREQTVRLLKGLLREFDDLEEVLEETESDPVSNENESELVDENESGTEVYQIYKGIVNTIDCLFQMSMVIRQPAQRDRLMGARKADSTIFESYDRNHVKTKYPRANNGIIDRLGVAISRRRAGLKYRERHHEKLAKGLNNSLSDQPEAASTILSETIATEFEGKQDIYFNETASDSGISQTSYAQTLLNSSDKIAIPPAPRESADGRPFECPYCFFIITVRDKTLWVRHVFTDLMPYVCVFPDCFTSAKLYASRREWYHHLQTSHSIQLERDSEFSCPLCHEEVSKGVRLDRHIGRHLEELALFALPRTYEDNDRESEAGVEPENIINASSDSDQSDNEDPQRRNEGNEKTLFKRVGVFSPDDEIFDGAKSNFRGKDDEIPVTKFRIFMP